MIISHVYLTYMYTYMYTYTYMYRCLKYFYMCLYIFKAYLNKPFMPP